MQQMQTHYFQLLILNDQNR